MFKEIGAYEGEDYYRDPLEETQPSPKDETKSSSTKEQEGTLYEETKREIPLPERENEIEGYSETEEEDEETLPIKKECEIDYYGDPIMETCLSQNAEAGPSQIDKQKETPFIEKEDETEHYDGLDKKREKVNWKEKLKSAMEEEKEKLKESLRAMGFIEKLKKDSHLKGAKNFTKELTKTNWKERLTSMMEKDKHELIKEMEAKGFIKTPRMSKKK